MIIFVTGGPELHRIAAACKRESRSTQTANDFSRGMQGARGPIAAAVRMSAISKLPKRGGLNEWAAASSISFHAIRAGRSGGLAVRVSKAGHDIKGLDEGLVIHPDNRPGHRQWYSQGVVPETISDPIRDEGGDRLQEAVEDAALRMAERIVRA